MSNENRYLRKGSIVTICLVPGDYAVTPGMLKYNGMEAAISKVCKSKKLGISENYIYAYELEDVISDAGVPYTFTREMIF